MNLDFNPGQYEIGEGVLTSIKSSVEEANTSFQGDFDKIVKAANDYKINLSSTITLGDLQTDLSTLSIYLDDVKKSAVLSKAACEAYSSSEGSEYDVQTLITSLSTITNITQPGVISRVAYTGALGGAMFVEGFASLFEDVGDCAIILGSGIVGLFDKKKSKAMKEFASRNLSKELIENNSVFEKINKYSYFDKNSAYADVFKFGGKAAAAIAAGGLVSKLAGGVSSTAVSNVTNGISSFGSDTRDNLSRGMGLKNSLLFAGATFATAHAVSKYVSPKVATKVGEVLSDTKVGTVIKGVDTVAANVFGSNIENVRNASKKVVDYSLKETKSKTGNLVSGDGNDETTNDAVAQDAANLGIDAAKETVEKTFEKSLENAAAEVISEAI